jgi:hypothetical protein
MKIIYKDYSYYPSLNKEKTKLNSFLSQGFCPKGKHAFRTTYRDIRRFKKRSELKCGFSPCGYRVLGEALALEFHF